MKHLATLAPAGVRASLLHLAVFTLGANAGRIYGSIKRRHRHPQPLTVGIAHALKESNWHGGGEGYGEGFPFPK